MPERILQNISLEQINTSRARLELMHVQQEAEYWQERYEQLYGELRQIVNAARVGDYITIHSDGKVTHFQCQKALMNEPESTNDSQVDRDTRLD